MASEQTNGVSAESVASIADGHSKKMHSKVVSVVDKEGERESNSANTCVQVSF